MKYADVPFAVLMVLSMGAGICMGLLVYEILDPTTVLGGRTVIMYAMVVLAMAKLCYVSGIALFLSKTRSVLYLTLPSVSAVTTIMVAVLMR